MRVTRQLADIFHEQDYPELLVGLSVADDAAVWQVDDDRALIFTTDFFTPIVDDPYDYGAIAAANALSDIYAMGGEPFLALNLAAFPDDLSQEIIVEIIRGGADKVKEAGAVVAGGHTIDDDEPKFGLAVLGFVHPDRLGTKANAQPGDRLILTKPLGCGVITTAHKRCRAEAEHLASAVRWMARLNRAAGLALNEVAKPHAVTDITGFGLLGHGWEVAERSGVALRVEYAALPFHPGTKQYAQEMLFPGMAGKNLADYAAHVHFAKELPHCEELLLFSPETSGGLFISLPPQEAQRYLVRCEEQGQEAWIIGEVTAGEPHIEVI